MVFSAYCLNMGRRAWDGNISCPSMSLAFALHFLYSLLINIALRYPASPILQNDSSYEFYILLCSSSKQTMAKPSWLLTFRRNQNSSMMASFAYCSISIKHRPSNQEHTDNSIIMVSIYNQCYSPPPFYRLARIFHPSRTTSIPSPYSRLTTRSSFTT